MRFLLALLFCCAVYSCTNAEELKDVLARLQKQEEEINALKTQLGKMKIDQNSAVNTMSSLTRQLMLQQLFVEERIRSDGNSGVKRIRTRSSGNKVYHTDSHTGNSVLAIHDHANNIRTVGMGEFIGVLNGVEFRTRHNDYGLRMPHRTLSGHSVKGFHKYEEIPFPEVPPQVLAKNNTEEQIVEMREWFKAWRDNDHKTRDYRKYFRPVLCYLEGAWMADAKKFEESFPSDRHHIDASSWFDLQEKIRFTSNTGRKSSLENYAYLPTTIAGTVNKGNLTVPVFAQWNYRILCHPIKRNLPLNRLRPLDDLSQRMGWVKKWKDVHRQRGTRFQLNSRDQPYWQEIRTRNTLLNDIMKEIPGKNNYNAFLEDDAFGLKAVEILGDNKPLNAAYYHNWYKVEKRDAMGVSVAHRGYHDESIYMALTNSTKVAPTTVNNCVRQKNPQTNKWEKKCTVYTQRVSYAIPLEIIYLTPLNRWNPYNIKFHDRSKRYIVTAGGRNGGVTPEKAWNGSTTNIYYITPSAFFSGSEVDKDKADTSRGAAGVLDQDGEVRVVRASGTRTLFPEITGVGIMRQRYPIAPLHEDGSTIMKEVAALRELIMEPKRYANMWRDAVGGDNSTEMLTYRLGASTLGHTHDVMLTHSEYADLLSGIRFSRETTEENGHSHILDLQYVASMNAIRYRTCDGKSKCFDNHPKILRLVNDDSQYIA